MIDNRVTLPLDRAVMAAWLLHTLVCPDVDSPHDDDCLIPLLEERDRLLAADALRKPHGGVDPDCAIGGAKCLACTGCQHGCHRHCTACGRERRHHDGPLGHAWENGAMP